MHIINEMNYIKCATHFFYTFRSDDVFSHLGIYNLITPIAIATRESSSIKCVSRHFREAAGILFI